jgi:NAD(P)-dependent dehydrogenase (short-subunit alcohol dehydrogenase family)
VVGCRTISKGENAIAEVKKEIPQSPSSLSTVQVDLASDESIEGAVRDLTTRFDRLDVLVNNGGASFNREQQTGKMTIREAWNASWDVNVTGSHIMTNAAVPLLLKSDDPRLMFVTSGLSSITETANVPDFAKHVNQPPPAGWPKPTQALSDPSYRSSKAGLNMAMRQWCQTLHNDGVKIWSISPGFLATNLGGVAPEQLKKVCNANLHRISTLTWLTLFLF